VGATAKQHQTHPKVMTKMVKKCSTCQSCIRKEVTSYKIHTLAPSEIPANLPGQFSLSGQIFLHWAAATLKGLVGFQNKKF
jgi:hypothetical protein